MHDSGDNDNDNESDTMIRFSTDKIRLLMYSHGTVICYLV